MPLPFILAACVGAAVGTVISKGTKTVFDNDNSASEKSGVAQCGDVICVRKTEHSPIVYFHFGIYVSNDDIIHYAPVGTYDSLFEAMENATVHETNLEGFLGDGCELYVCNFDKEYSEPSKRKIEYELPKSVMGPPFKIDVVKNYKKREYKLYSPEETVERALSKLGDTKYNLAFNNCEHFAIWCKTGISESHQVNNLLKTITFPPSNHPLVIY